MKKLILVSTIFFIVTVNGYSQTKKESIKELFRLMQQDSMIDKMFNSILPSMMSQMQSNMDSEDSTASARSNELMNSTMTATKEMAKKLINEDMVAIYDKYFSQSEINDFIAFYKSSSGQKLLRSTPDIQKDLMTVMMQKYMPEIQKTIKSNTDKRYNTDGK